MFRGIKSIYIKCKDLFKSDLNRKIFSHSAWILTGNLISKVALLLATVIMARYLGQDEYGKFGIVKSTILMFALFAGLELGMTATKYIAQYSGVDNRKVERIVGLSNLLSILVSITVAILVYSFSDIISRQIAAPELSSIIKISSFILFFSSMNGVQTGVLNGLHKFKEISIINAISGVTSAVLLILASLYGGLLLVVLAFGVNFVIVYLLNHFVLKKCFYNMFDVSIFSRSNFQELGVIWRFSLPAIFAGMMIGPLTWYCNYLLVNSPNGYAEMADFDIANQWRTTVLFIPSALSQIVLPLLSSSVENKQQYREVYLKNLKVNFFISLAFIIMLVLMTPLIIRFYGESYRKAYYPMIIMLSTTLFISVNNVIGQVIASQGKMWIGFWVNFFWGLLLVSFSYIFITVNGWGAIGISLAFLLSYIIHTVVQFVYVRKFF